MKLLSKRTVRVEEWVTIKVSYRGKAFEISVMVVDGSVKGESHENGLATSYLTYFNETPEHTRQRHFLQIKKYLQKQ